MIRQELMDNIKEIKNALDVVINNKVPEYEKIGWMRVAHQTATNLETMVAAELEAQRQEQSEDIVGIDLCDDEDLAELESMLKEVDEDIKMGIGIYDTEETKEFKRWCFNNKVIYTNVKVVNEYLKERGV